jgi:hypothetical protein
MGWAWLKGANHVQVKFDAYELAVETAGNAQLEKNKQVTKAGVDISKKNGADYEKALSDLARLYGVDRVRDNPGRSKTPAISNARPGVIARSPDVVLGAGISTPTPNECAALEADAAATTLEYLWLREWYFAEQAAWNF